MGKTRYDWNGNRIKRLREKIGCSQKTAAEALGISNAAYAQYEENRANPGFQAMIRMADFFGVPIDYLIGRTNYTKIDLMFEDCLKGLRESKALDIIASGKKLPAIEGMEAPYPYNLVETIYRTKDEVGILLSETQRKELFEIAKKLPFGEEQFLNGIVCDQERINLSEEQKKGLEHALSTLSEREQEVIRLRFKEKLTLEECSTRHGVTRERIRQIEAKAIRKLRHPSRRKYYVFGFEEVRKEKERYQKELAELEETISRVNELKETAKGLKTLIRELKQEDEGITIEELDLSTRPFNCLWRAGIRTISDLTKMTSEEVMGLRNMGVGSYYEIVAKLSKRGYTLNS